MLYAGRVCRVVHACDCCLATPVPTGGAQTLLAGRISASRMVYGTSSKHAHQDGNEACAVSNLPTKRPGRMTGSAAARVPEPVCGTSGAQNRYKAAHIYTLQSDCLLYLPVKCIQPTVPTPLPSMAPMSHYMWPRACILPSNSIRSGTSGPRSSNPGPASPHSAARAHTAACHLAASLHT